MYVSSKELGFSGFITLPPAGNRLLLKTHLETQENYWIGMVFISTLKHCCHLNVIDSKAKYSDEGLTAINWDMVFV